VPNWDRTSTERTEAEAAYEYLQDFLKSDYDRIREREELCTQIEMYHEGLELQEDGTYKSEPGPTAERNAEFAYLARLEEKCQRAEKERRISEEQRAKENRRRYIGYSR